MAGPPNNHERRRNIPVRRSGAAAGTSAGPSIPDDNQNQPMLGQGIGQSVGQTLGHSIPNQMNQNFNIQANVNPQMGLSGVLTPQSGAMGANGDFSFNTGLNTASNITGNTTGNTTGGNRLGGAPPASQFGGGNRLGGPDSTTGGQFRGNSPLPNRSVTPNRPAASLTPSSRPNTPSRGGIHTFSSLPQEPEEPPQTVGGGVVLPDSGNWSGSTESNGVHLAGELGTPASTVQPPPPTLANMTGGNRLGGPTVQSTGGNVLGGNTLGGNRLGGQVQGQPTPFGGGQRLGGPLQPQFTQGGTVLTPNSGTMNPNGDFSFGTSGNTTGGNRLGGNPMARNQNMAPSGGGNVLGGNRLGGNIAPQSAPSGGNVLGGGNTLGGGNRLGGSTVGTTSGQNNYGGTINPNSGTMGSNGDFSFGTPSGGNTLGGGNRLGGNQPQYQTQQQVTISHTPGQATTSGGSRLGGAISATANVSMNGQQQSAGGQGMSIPIDMSQLLGGLNLGGALGGGQSGQQGGQGVQTSFRFFVNGQEVDSNNGSINIPMNMSGGTGGNGESTQSFSIPIRLNGAGGGGAGGNFEMYSNLRDVEVGFSQEQIDTIPSEVLKQDFTEYECIVCLEPMEKGEEVRTLPCSHKLHTECIDPWLRSNKVCPVCRSGIPLTQT